MERFRRIVLIVGLVALSIAGYSQSVDFTLNDKGLQSLTYSGWQFITDPNYNGTIALWYGGPTFKRSDGSTYQGSSTVVGSGRDAVLQKATILYSWGSISCTYSKPTATRLNMHITIRNNTGDTLIYHNDPNDPFQNNAPPFLVFDTPNANPSVADAGDNTQVLQNIPRWADYPMGAPAVWINLGSTGTMTLCNDNSPYSRTMWGRMTHWNSTSRFDARFWTGDDIAPYGTGQFDISLRFGAPGTTLAGMAKEIYQRYTSAVPFRAQSPDRRMIGAEFLSSTVPHPSDGKNPRGWFLNDDSIDITTQSGLASFQSKMLARIDADIVNLKKWNCQGLIIWDIEGQEYNHDISYVGDPRMVFQEAPEMAYKGTHTLCVADEIFKKVTDAGLKVGVCLRPTNFLLGGTQQEVTDHEATILDKVAYAKNRWGCTLFYCDSTVYRGGLLDAHSLPVEDVFRRALDAYPDVSLMGENQTPRYYAYGGPFDQLNVNNVAITPQGIQDLWPGAFTTNYIADANFTTYGAGLLSAIKRGDQLVGRIWFDDASTISAYNLYNQAGKRPTVSITSPAANSTYMNPTSITVTSTASDADGSIAKVELYAGGTLVGTDTTAPYSFTWTDFTPGNTYCLSAKATDNNGCSTVSDPVKVRIEAPLSSGEAMWAFKTSTGSDDTIARELGATFHSTVDGRITKIRVFGLNNETGIHLARIWRNYDNTVVGGPYQFIYGGGNGWVTLDLPTPVGIQANVDYTVSVSTGDDDNKWYPCIPNDATAGNNGSHLVWNAGAGAYGTSLGARPTQTSSNSNYLRDVVFEVGLPAYSMFDTATPTGTLNNFGEYGLRFKTSAPGRVTKIRYYKPSGESGVHTGNIWSSAGALLASASFINETDSGWQEAILATPVIVSSDTTYTVSVNCNGQYATATALAGSDRFMTDGPIYSQPGVLGAYIGAAGTYPTSTSATSHYFRDIVFEPLLPVASVGISGHITDNSGNSLTGVQVISSYGMTATTDSAGNYTLLAPTGWSGTATATADGYVFSPSSRPYTSVSSAITGQDFVALPPLSNVRGVSDGTGVDCGPGVVTAKFGTTFYIESSDRSFGIRVDSGSAPPVGTKVEVAGTVSTDPANLERRVQATTVTPQGTGAIAPVGLVSAGMWGETPGNAALGLNNQGLLVRLEGRVTQVEPSGQWFYVDDGTGFLDGTLTGGAANLGVRVVADGRAYSGGFVAVTGIASCFKGAGGERLRVIKPRDGTDVRAI